MVVRARRLSEGKVRAAEGAFLAEGPQSCREAARFATVERLFTTAAAAARYDDIVAEAAALLESLAINHPFVDGNKRMAFAAADVFQIGRAHV